jgi:hypothetical protein
MSFKELKENFCERAILKWKRFLRATEKPTVKAKSDLSVSLCADDETKVDLVDLNVDSEIKLRDLVAAFVIISFICSLLRAIFGRR